MSKIFISYSRKDEKWRERIVSHLEAICDSSMKVWYDTRIGPGEEWYPEIETALNTAHAVILVVSRNFLTSEFIREEEIPRILDRKEKDGLIIVPVIAESCAWKKVPWLSEVAIRPKTGEPLSGGNGHQTDAELTRIAEELYDLLQESHPQPPSGKKHSHHFVEIQKDGRKYPGVSIKGKPYNLKSVADRLIKSNPVKLKAFDEQIQLDIGQYLHEQISKVLGQNTPDENEADIRIISPDKRITALPWHLLAKDKIFRTRWAVSLSTQSHTTDCTLPSAPKILIIVPQPVGMDKTDAESHLENLENRLSEKNHHFSIGVGIKVAYTWEEYVRELERSAPQIIYFYGHCKNDPNNPLLCFASGQKYDLRLVSSAEFAEPLKKMATPPALVYVNCPGHITGLFDLGMLLGDSVPALVLSRNLTSPEIAQAQALLLLEDILTQGIPPHRSVASLYGRMDERLDISTADARWMTPMIFAHYDRWNAKKSEPLSRRIHDPFWHLKIDRVRQFSTVTAQTLQMLQERKPRSLAFVWYGTEGQGIERFHHRLSIELKNYLLQFNTFPCEVRPEWPTELDRPEIAFRDCLTEAFGVCDLEDIPAAIRQMNLGISGKQTLVYVRHQPVTSPLLINPKSLKTYLEWWDAEFIPLLERQQFALLGVSFVVKNPPKFQQAAVKTDRLDDLPLKHTVFRLLDAMEKIAKKDLLDFLRTHNIHFPVRHRDKIIKRILDKTGGHYEQTVQELRVLVAQSWDMSESEETESTSVGDDYDY